MKTKAKNYMVTFEVDQSAKQNLICYTKKEAAKAMQLEMTRLINQDFHGLASDIKITPRVNKFATYVGYTDCEPYEIIRVISEQTIEIRPMETKLINAADLNFEVGGFSAHCTNGRAQKYSYESNPDADTIRIRKRKGSSTGLWGKGSLNFYLAEEPYKYYDYNF